MKEIDFGKVMELNAKVRHVEIVLGILRGRSI